MAAGAVVALAAWSAPPAAAQDAQAELRQLITDIESFVASESGGEATVRTSRPPETRMDGGAAVATLADLSVVGRNGNVLELGTLTLSQREVAPGRVRYELSLPTRISERGIPTPVTVTTGGGTLAVVHDESSGLLLEVDFRMNDLNVPAQGAGNPATTMGLLQLGYAVTARADGLSDANARFALRGLRVAQPGNNMGGSLGELSLAMTVQGFHLEDIEGVRDAFVQAQGSFEARWAQAIERLQAVMQEHGLGGSTVDMTLTDGVYNDGSPTPAGSITRATLRQVMSGENQDDSTYQLTYAQEGLTLRQDLVVVPQYIPGQINLNLTLEHLPMRALHAYTATLAATTAGAGGNDSAAAVMMLLQALQQAGTTLRMAPIALEAQAVGATLNGAVAANANAALQATAAGDLAIRGLDAVQRELGGQGGGPGSPAGVITMLMALGQQGTGPNGQPVRNYHIEVTQAGQLMLNGTDMSALIGAATGPGGGPPAAQPGRPAAPAPNPPTRGK
jgi:hypothetical protein